MTRSQRQVEVASLVGLLTLLGAFLFYSLLVAFASTIRSGHAALERREKEAAKFIVPCMESGKSAEHCATLLYWKSKLEDGQ